MFTLAKVWKYEYHLDWYQKYLLGQDILWQQYLICKQYLLWCDYMQCWNSCYKYYNKKLRMWFIRHKYDTINEIIVRSCFFSHGAKLISVTLAPSQLSCALDFISQQPWQPSHLCPMVVALPTIRLSLCVGLVCLFCPHCLTAWFNTPYWPSSTLRSDFVTWYLNMISKITSCSFCYPLIFVWA